MLLFLIPILTYQFPNEMISKICNLTTFFFTNHFINNFINLLVNSTHSEGGTKID